MHMVLRPTYANYLTACCVDKFANIRMQLCNMLFIDHRACCLGVKDDMKIYFTK